MDFSYSEDQQLLMTAVESLLERFRDPSIAGHDYVGYSQQLQDELFSSGFLDIVKEPGFSPLEGALLVEAVASCPVSAEVANTTLIAPLLDGSVGTLAMAWNSGSPVRYLSQATSVGWLEGSELVVGSLSGAEIQHQDSVVAYPLGRLAVKPSNAIRYSSDITAQVKRRGMIGLAAEAAGLMRGALENTINYVKERKQFGQPLGSFQAIQHRLAEDFQAMQACRSLAFRAAYTDSDEDASVACLYAQESMRKIIYDCHQFSGAMGLTLEYPLHLWTYRLKYLQGEMGGKIMSSAVLSQNVWGKAVASC